MNVATIIAFAAVAAFQFMLGWWYAHRQRDRADARKEIPMATGENLDRLANVYGIHRIVEDDASLRARTTKQLTRFR